MDYRIEISEREKEYSSSFVEVSYDAYDEAGKCAAYFLLRLKKEWKSESENFADVYSAKVYAENDVPNIINELYEAMLRDNIVYLSYKTEEESEGSFFVCDLGFTEDDWDNSGWYPIYYYSKSLRKK